MNVELVPIDAMVSSPNWPKLELNSAGTLKSVKGAQTN